MKKSIAVRLLYFTVFLLVIGGIVLIGGCGKEKYSIETDNGTLYLYDADGNANSDTGLISLDGEEYYANGNGTLRTGWTAISDTEAAYFDGTTGKMVKDETVGFIKIPEDGRVGEVYAKAVMALDECGWTLWDAFEYAAGTKYVYKWRKMRKDSSEEYAMLGFTERKGNCFVFAAEFCYMAKILGYDAHHIEGAVFKPDHVHSWVIINHDDGMWVYDPDFNQMGEGDDEKKGYHFKYKTKGTWKYIEPKYLN